MFNVQAHGTHEGGGMGQSTISPWTQPPVTQQKSSPSSPWMQLEAPRSPYTAANSHSHTSPSSTRNLFVGQVSPMGGSGHGVSIPNSPSPGYGVHECFADGRKKQGSASVFSRFGHLSRSFSLSLDLSLAFITLACRHSLPENLLLVINKWPNGEWIYHLLLRNL